MVGYGGQEQSRIHLRVLMGRFADPDGGMHGSAMENLTFECRHGSGTV
jgi:hypothetical protein